MCDVWSADNDWVLRRYDELLKAPRHRLGDVYRTIPAGVVYLISFSLDPTALYVGVTMQKGGRFNAYIRDARERMRQKFRSREQLRLGREIGEQELQHLISDLTVQWIEEPLKARQERIEHFALAVNPPPLNGIGRATWGTHTR